MRNRSSVVVALLVIAIGGVTVGLAQLGLRPGGIEFPDGSVQTSAAAPQGDFVQVSTNVGIPDFEFCAIGDLYTVPEGKELEIQWIELTGGSFMSTDFPMDVLIRTWFDGNQGFMNLVRLANPDVINGSFFATEHWNSPVTIYSQGGETVQVNVCRDSDSDDSGFVNVSINGRLFDE